MKTMTKLEFEDRILALARARAIFMPHLTDNISIAFALYQKVLAEREREIFINSSRDYNKPKLFDKYERPQCPNCGKDLFLRVIGVKQGPRNKYGYRTCWECLDCAYEKYSTKTIKNWMEELRRK